MTKITTTRRTIGDTIRLPISNRPGCFASFCPDGRRILVERGVGSLFMSTDGSRLYSYVRCYDPFVAGETETVARVLMGAGKGRRVRYLDGDVFNLRLDNLHLERGGAKGRTARLAGVEGAAG